MKKIVIVWAMKFVSILPRCKNFENPGIDIKLFLFLAISHKRRKNSLRCKIKKNQKLMIIVGFCASTVKFRLRNCNLDFFVNQSPGSLNSFLCQLTPAR